MVVWAGSTKSWPVAERLGSVGWMADLLVWDEVGVEICCVDSSSSTWWCRVQWAQPASHRQSVQSRPLLESCLHPGPCSPRQPVSGPEQARRLSCVSPEASPAPKLPVWWAGHASESSITPHLVHQILTWHWLLSEPHRPWCGWPGGGGSFRASVMAGRRGGAGVIGWLRSGCSLA